MSLSHFIVAFRTYERILKAPLTFLHLVSWILSFYLYPVIACPLLAYYVHYKYLEYVKFFTNYPYTRVRASLGGPAVLVDFSPVVIGLEAWRTLSDNSWEHGEGWKGCAIVMRSRNNHWGVKFSRLQTKMRGSSFQMIKLQFLAILLSYKNLR